MTITAALALTLLIGLPLMLLAAGVLIHAYVLAGQRRAAPLDPTDRALESIVTGSVDQLLAELHGSIDDLRGQLAGQRATLEGLLSDRPADREPPLYAGAAPTLATAPAAGLAGYAPLPRAAGEFEARTATPAAGDFRGAIDQLVAEGLSDRAIARRLHIGLEEVRISRARRSQDR